MNTKVFPHNVYRVWKDLTHPHVLNQVAEALGGNLNTSPPAFVRFRPGPFLRPFDLRSGVLHLALPTFR